MRRHRSGESIQELHNIAGVIGVQCDAELDVCHDLNRFGELTDGTVVEIRSRLGNVAEH